MFESQSQIIEYHDNLINQVDIFFEQQLTHSKIEPNYRQDIIQKIRDLVAYNLKIDDKKFKFCYFFGKIDNIYKNFHRRLDFDDQLSKTKIKYGLLLITNDFISKEIYDKLK